MYFSSKTVKQHWLWGKELGFISCDLLDSKIRNENLQKWIYHMNKSKKVKNGKPPGNS